MKIVFTVLLLLFLSIRVFFAQVTREQADEIVLEYIKSEIGHNNFGVFVNPNTPNTEGFVITTSSGETVKAKYVCWVYCITPEGFQPALGLPARQHYLFVKEDNGSLLEIITSNDLGHDLSSWTAVKVPQGVVELKGNKQFLYPNPVDDCLTFPCNGENTRVEIYDLKGTRLFSEMLSSEGTCQLNISFLSAGTYIVNISGEMYKIIKN